MIAELVLPTTHEEQTLNYTCGSACINIVLSRWGKQRVQSNVWIDVQANTSSVRPANARWVTGSFATQACDKCSEDTQTDTDGTVYGDYHCWFTSPEAMATTINASSPSPVAVDYIADGLDTIRRLADSITLGVPAVFTTLPSLHWVVAVGYQYDDVQPATGTPSVSWGAKFLTGIYVRNPSQASSPTGTVQMMTPPGLLSLEGLLMSIECGPRNGQYPVVAGVAVNQTSGSLNPRSIVSMAPQTIWRLVIPPRWIRKFWVRPRPGPPPKS